MNFICQNCKHYHRGLCDLSSEAQDPQDSCEDFKAPYEPPSCGECIYFNEIDEICKAAYCPFGEGDYD